jgi:hypothetical protein
MINFIFSTILFTIPFFGDPPEIIIPYQNNNQLILIFSENNRSHEYEQALLELSRDPLGLDQRDLIIFEIFTTGGIYPDGSALSEADAEILRNYFKIETSAFTIVIINKQLEEIFRSSHPVSVKDLFKTID